MGLTAPLHHVRPTLGISGGIAWRGLSADVFRLVLSEHTSITGDVVLRELARVLRNRIRLPGARVDDIVAFLREQEVVPKPEAPSEVAIRDEDDR